MAIIKFLDRTVVDFTAENVTNQTVQESLNLKTVVSGTTAQYFRFNLTLEPTYHDDVSGALAVFADQCSKQFSTFDFTIPQEHIGSQTAGTVNGSVNSNTLSGTFSDVKVGRFVTFSGHDKLYIITAASASSISVYPKLIKAVSGATNLTPTAKVMYEDLARLSFTGGRSTPIVRVREVV